MPSLCLSDLVYRIKSWLSKHFMGTLKVQIRVPLVLHMLLTVCSGLMVSISLLLMLLQISLIHQKQIILSVLTAWVTHTVSFFTHGIKRVLNFTPHSSPLHKLLSFSMSDLESILDTHCITYPQPWLTNSSSDNVFHYFQNE